MRRKLAFALVLVIGLLGLAEGAARLVYSPQTIHAEGLFEFDPDKVFRLRSNHSGEYINRPVQTNSFGHRDREISEDKAPGSTRILVLGDSITFGHGVLEEEAWPAILESRLRRASDASTDVINTAVPGNSAMQEFYDLERALVLDPDLVVLQFTLNDIVEPFVFLRRFGGEGVDYHGVEDVSRAHFYLSQKSALYLYLRDLLRALRLGDSRPDTQRTREAHKEAYAASRLVDHPDDPKLAEAWEEYMHWLSRIRRTAARRELPMVLLLSPFQFQLEQAADRAHPQRRLTQWCEEEEVTCVDVLALLRQGLEARMGTGPTNPQAVRAFWREYFMDHDHYKQEGHRQVAAWMEPVLLEVLGAPTP